MVAAMMLIPYVFNEPEEYFYVLDKKVRILQMHHSNPTGSSSPMQYPGLLPEITRKKVLAS